MLHNTMAGNEMLSADQIREVMKQNEATKSANLATMRELADQNDRLDRKNKKLQKQLNDIVYPPIK